MTKVFPNGSSAVVSIGEKSSSSSSSSTCDDSCGIDRTDSSTVALTVWKKSLLFNCDGFTVFDSVGNLVFRVDNYMSRHKGEILLMDASGNCLLTIRRKKLSLMDTWTVYEGETCENPIFSVRKNMNLLNTKCLAHVNSAHREHDRRLYEIEGSYSRRSCVMFDSKKRQAVAEIKKKEASVKGVAFGFDVFTLIVQPCFDSALAMALVILLDQMFGSSSYSSSGRRLL